MIETKQFSMVIGCGERGAAWTAKQNSERIIALDLKPPKGKHGELVLGDVFNLPIKDGVISHIYADFIVNGLIDREIAAPQIFENPDLLDTNYFPPLVREWYKSINRSHDRIRSNVQQVGYLLKTAALREMWRVLANKGRLQIIDIDKNINWIGHFAPQIIDENPMFVGLEPIPISTEDFERSGSLEKLTKGKVHVQKIVLTKSRPPVGAKIPLDFSGTRL